MLLSIPVFIFGDDVNSSLEVYVSDVNDRPLYGAIVTLENTDTKSLIKLSSDKQGQCFFEKVIPGNYILKSNFIGYYDSEKSISITSSKDLQENITMDVKSIYISELEIIRDKNKKNITGTVTSINAKVLSEINPMGTQEILEYVPGVNGFSDDGLGNSRINIGIRGINPRRSSRVLVLEDGVPIQPAIYIYPNMYYNPPVERISEVEVIKGSASILYGPQTMGGVINYLTSRPSEGKKTTVTFTSGENGYASTFVETSSLFKSPCNPELQLLYKRGDGFRDNNDFQQINATLKLNLNKSSDENIYLKTNINYENTNATYTGLTLHTFQNNPNFNPKEHDNFELFRSSIDLIRIKKIRDNLTMTSTSFLSFFNRDWWREDDIFVNANNLDSEDPNALGYTSTATLARTGNGESSSGRLRTFYVAGSEVKYTVNNLLGSFKNSMDIGARVYFERFIDDGMKGYTADAREGLYYVPAEDFTDLNGNGLYDSFVVVKNPDTGQYDLVTGEPEPHVDCSINNPEICDGHPDWNSAFGDGKWNDDKIVGQSHHYQSLAFSSFISHKIELENQFIIKTGMRFEIFEQERIDRLIGARYQDKTTFVFLPGIGFNKKIGNITLFGGLHRGFTPPSSGSIKILNFGDNVNDGGLNLLAEKSWNKEIGIRTSSVEGNLDLEMALFHVDIKNMVAAGRSIDFKNLGKIESMGLEMSSVLSIMQTSSLKPTLYLTYSFLHTNIKEASIMSSINPSYYWTGAELNQNPEAYCEEIIYNDDGETTDCKKNISGNELPYSPNHSLVIGISNTLFNKFESRVDYKFVSSVYTDFENIEGNEFYCLNSLDCQDESKIDFSKEYKVGIAGPVPSYGIINLSLRYNIKKSLNATISVKNLLDHVYIGSRLHSSPGVTDATTSTGIIPGARRQFNISVNYTF